MENTNQGNNGWDVYKKNVVQQLDYLAVEMKDTRTLVTNIDKQIATLITRDKSDLDHGALIKRTDDIVKDNVVWQSGFAKEYETWKLEVSNTLAATKARDEASRKSWTIVTVAISLAINAAALILAFIIHASRATP